MGLKRRPRRQSIDEVVLAGLSHEYSASDAAATDAKIRRSLRVPEERGFAAMKDFDTMRLRQDLAEAFPSVRPWLVAAFVHQAIYLYYLR